MADPSRSIEAPTPTPTQQIGCLALIFRLVWMGVGNIALVLLAFFIAEEGAFSGFDIAFWGAVAGLAVVRYVDITVLKGFNTDWTPASLSHFWRYLLVLLGVSTVLWALAQAAGRRLLS